jgi:hypothetical protein
MKSIPDLCRLLPASEPEIRERECEFDEVVRLATDPETTGRQYLRRITDAKAATDAIIARYVKITKYADSKWVVVVGMPGEVDGVCAEASTEELARSAAALLAAEALKGLDTCVLCRVSTLGRCKAHT